MLPLAAQIGAVPQDIQDQISTLRQGLDSQNEQLGLVSTAILHAIVTLLNHTFTQSYTASVKNKIP